MVVQALHSCHVRRRCSGTGGTVSNKTFPFEQHTGTSTCLAEYYAANVLLADFLEMPAPVSEPAHIGSLRVHFVEELCA
jgi:hypothetical protein